MPAARSAQRGSPGDATFGEYDHTVASTIRHSIHVTADAGSTGAPAATAAAASHGITQLIASAGATRAAASRNICPIASSSSRRICSIGSPAAPAIAVTINNGFVMPAWYDILSLSSSARRIDEAGLSRSRDAVRHLIARENARGIPSEHIFIAGFSQGGAVAYTTALSHPEALGGVIALSTYIPSTDLLASELSVANRTIPVFAAHGSEDDVVSPALGMQARDFLRSQGYAVDWQEYPMPHSVCLEEVQAIGRWLRERLA